MQGWQGPLPPPAALEAFEKILPGSAKTIMDEFQGEAAHRRKLEIAQAAQVGRETLLGQVLALIFAAGALGATAFAIAEHQQWAAGILGGGVIVGGIVAFLKRRSD